MLSVSFGALLAAATASTAFAQAVRVDADDIGG